MSNLCDYIKYKNDTLFFNNMDISKLIEEYGDNLEVSSLDVIDKQIKYLKHLFNKAIKDNKYKGNYHYAYAMKANYEGRTVKRTLSNLDYVETSSFNDLCIIEYLLDKKIIGNNFTILCNGFKKEDYVKKIISIRKKGIRIIPIIENIDELKAFINYNIIMDIGLRINVDAARKYAFNDNSVCRFGLEFSDIIDNLSLIKKSKLNVTLFHYHMNGSINNIDSYINFMEYLFNKYYVPLKKEFKNLNYFDIGGGMPIDNNLNSKFSYNKLVNKIVLTLKNLCDNSHLDYPDIIGEHGRYTVAYHTFNILKIDFVKKIDDEKYWYILNNSIINLFPDIWLDNTKFLVLPVKQNKKNIKVKLGGITCDPADVYTYNANRYLLLPKYKDNMYLVFFGVGAYEKMLAGVNGIHHCVISEPKKIIINDKKISVLEKKQDVNEVLEKLNYK